MTRRLSLVLVALLLWPSLAIAQLGGGRFQGYPALNQLNTWSALQTFSAGIVGSPIIGGTGTTSTLTLQSTSGVGTTGADIVFKVGNNGATEAGRILNSGNVGIRTTDLDGTPPIGAITIKGSTNNGSTNIFVGRDSDEANVFSVNTDGETIVGSVLTVQSAGGVIQIGGLGGVDVVMGRDGSDVLAMRRGVNAQTFRLYSTTDSGSNYAYLSISASGGPYKLLPQAAGTGTLSPVAIGDGGTKPTCNATNRGGLWYDAGGAGVLDTFELCRKDAADVYAWVTLF